MESYQRTIHHKKIQHRKHININKDDIVFVKNTNTQSKLKPIYDERKIIEVLDRSIIIKLPNGVKHKVHMNFVKLY